jgi:hypothetical protein
MMDELMKQFQTLDVKCVYTMIVAQDENIRKLFLSAGFKEGSMAHLEKDL